MQVVLNIKNENILLKLKEFIDDFSNDISLVNDDVLNFVNSNDIEILNVKDDDYKLINKIKKENNKKYTINEARKLLNDS